MYIRPEQIAEQYEMEVKSISKGRDCFLCETDLGMRALKEYRGSVERAEFLAGMLDFLKGQNIVAEQIFYTKEGEIFARDEEEQNYLLLSVFRGAECDTKSREDTDWKEAACTSPSVAAASKPSGLIPKTFSASSSFPRMISHPATSSGMTSWAVLPYFQRFFR